MLKIRMLNRRRCIVVAGKRLSEESEGSVFERLGKLWKGRKTREKGYIYGTVPRNAFSCTTSSI